MASYGPAGSYRVIGARAVEAVSLLHLRLAGVGRGRRLGWQAPGRSCRNADRGGYGARVPLHRTGLLRGVRY